MLWVPAIRKAPSIAFGGSLLVEQEESGIRFEIPQRLARFQGRLRGLPAWAIGAGSGEAIFCGLESIPEGEVMDADRFDAFWSQGQVFETRTREDVVALAEGWTVHAMEIQDEKGLWFRVVEHNLQRGQWLVRAGYRIRSNGSSPTKVRTAFYGRFLEGLQVVEPPALSEARQAWTLKKDTRTSLDFADQLQRIGAWSEVEEVLKERAERTPPNGRQARRRWNRILRERIGLWNLHPEVVPSEGGKAWVRGALAAVPRDTGIQREGILWLGGQGACDEAKIAYDAFKELRRNAALVSGIDESLGEICSGNGGAN